MGSETALFVDVALSWNRATSGTTAVLRQLDDGAWSEIARVEGTEYVVERIDPQRSYVFAAADVLADGSLDAEEDWEVTRVAPGADEGRPAPPGTPAGFAVAQDGAVLNARWDAAADAVTTGYELRQGATWEDAVRVADALAASPFSWPWPASGAQTFLLKAIDSTGRACRVAAEATVTIAELDTHVTAATMDEGAGGWTGTKTRVETDAGSLRLTRIPQHFGAATVPFGSLADVPCFARYFPSGTYESATVNLGKVEKHRVEIDLTTAQPVDAGLPFGAVKRAALGRRKSSDETYVPLGTRGTAAKNSWRFTPLDPVDATVEIDTSPTNAGAWDGWRPYVPGDYSFWRCRFRATLRGDGLRFTKLPKLVVRRRRFNHKDEGDVALPGLAPGAVHFTKPFTGPPKVTMNVVGVVAAPAFKIEITGVTATGCNVEVFAAGVSIACTLHWHALGV